jgi:hypothetical protein
MYQREHLRGDYNWTDESANNYTGSPSRRLFNRYDGHQVLFIINSFVTGDNNIEDVRLVEDLILGQLPITAKSEISVFSWLEKEYKVQKAAGV